MRFARQMVAALTLVLLACQPARLPTVTIIENDQVLTLQTNERVPSVLLDQAGITLRPNDRLLLNGLPITVNQPITTSPITLQIRRAVPITLIASDGAQKLQSSAFTVGEALQEAPVWLYAENRVDPPVQSPIPNSPISNSPLTIYQLPSHELTVTSN